MAELLQHEITSELTGMLTSSTTLATTLKVNPNRSDLKRLISKIIITQDQTSIHLSLNGLQSVICTDNSAELGSSSQDDDIHVITCSTHMKRCGHGKRIILGSGKDNSHNSGKYKGAVKADPALLKSITQAHIWFEYLKAGKSFKEIGEQTNIDQRHVARTIKLAFLAPNIVEAIIQGHEPQGLTAERLLRLSDLSVDWQEQQKLLGFI